MKFVFWRCFGGVFLPHFRNEVHWRSDLEFWIHSVFHSVSMNVIFEFNLYGINRLSATKAVCISCGMTLFSIFDIPVFWPILLLYFIVLFTITMKRQIEHMIKFSYIPCDCFKKKRYKGRHKEVVKKKKKAVPVMPKVRPPIKSLPNSGLKKVSRDWNDWRYGEGVDILSHTVIYT